RRLRQGAKLRGGVSEGDPAGRLYRRRVSPDHEAHALRVAPEVAWAVMRASTTRRRVSSALGLLALVAHASAIATANAAEPPAAEAPAREPDDASKTHAPVAEGSPPEEPPPAPYEKTLVLDASLGARAFVGDMARVATPGMWLHAQLGYELLRWLML